MARLSHSGSRGFRSMAEFGLIDKYRQILQSNLVLAPSIQEAFCSVCFARQEILMGFRMAVWGVWRRVSHRSGNWGIGESGEPSGTWSQSPYNPEKCNS